MKFKNVIRANQFTNPNELKEIFKITDEMKKMDENGTLGQPLLGKVMASIFYEPSTRTRLSFETAMLKLGGSVTSAENAAGHSSAKKGESLEDAIKVISAYVDVLVLRHPDDNSGDIAEKCSQVPVLNGGSGKAEHPTQALLDMYTIQNELSRLDNLKIALVGDLLYGRTVHSLLTLLLPFKNISFYLVAPDLLKMPSKYIDQIKKAGADYQELNSFEDILSEVDVFYMTRIQKERFENPADYDKLKGVYVLDAKHLKKMKPEARILHPLPRVDEINVNVDNDPRAAYFRQAKNGQYVRMALLKLLLTS